jgi:hypothetical protein
MISIDFSYLLELDQPRPGIFPQDRKRVDLHGKYNPTAQHQPCQPRHSTRPKGKNAFVLEDGRRARKTIFVVFPRFYRLHSRLDGVEWLRGESANSSVPIHAGTLHSPFQPAREDSHGDQPSTSTQTKRAEHAQLLPWSNVALRKLLQRSITREPDSGIRRLPRRSGYKALEEASNALLSCDDGRAVQEAAHTWVWGFAVVDPAKSLAQPKGRRRLYTEIVTVGS